MISETGSVVELKGKQVAVVLCKKSSFCRHCASMESCQVGDDNRTMVVEALNAIGAKVGDKVRIVTSSRSFLQSSFLLYIVPLLSLIVGGILGQIIGEGHAERVQSRSFIRDSRHRFSGRLFSGHPCRYTGPAARGLHATHYRILPEEETFVMDLQNGH